jgi:molybdopterin converting factor small subunit
MTTMRFFAAARAAVGVDEVAVTSPTLGEALAEVAATVTIVDAAAWERLGGRCSYLVDGVSTRDPETGLQGATLVDVMPPFSGG